jgi:hypothetical protein
VDFSLLISTFLLLCARLYFSSYFRISLLNSFPFQMLDVMLLQFFGIFKCVSVGKDICYTLSRFPRLKIYNFFFSIASAYKKKSFLLWVKKKRSSLYLTKKIIVIVVSENTKEDFFCIKNILS